MNKNNDGFKHRKEANERVSFSPSQDSSMSAECGSRRIAFGRGNYCLRAMLRISAMKQETSVHISCLAPVLLYLVARPDYVPLLCLRRPSRPYQTSHACHVEGTRGGRPGSSLEFFFSPLINTFLRISIDTIQKQQNNMCDINIFDYLKYFILLVKE
ncbi:hypothetical protein HPP92_002585 [Vanilla planifolia]|uniref:Uncharacterized protein n=1 Tax=Vanilla planifolia TaxID=51239 RepID=A0A835S4M9_VANPL|nr:hypothetical protein HPP92_002585 [Vanilla planifolia]